MLVYSFYVSLTRAFFLLVLTFSQRSKFLHQLFFVIANLRHFLLKLFHCFTLASSPTFVVSLSRLLAFPLPLSLLDMGQF